MHAFRSSARQRRRFVWLTLLAWSFALISGVVNACVLNLPEGRAAGSSLARHGEAVTHARALEAFGPHGSGAHEADPGGLHQHGQEPGTSGKNTCLKFCDDESSARAKSTSSGADMVAAAVDSRVERRLALPAPRLSAGALPTPPRAQGPPLVIRFLRLTL